MSAMRTYNVEADFPSLDEARRRVLAQLRLARREQVRVLKVIHGYGSTGRGGKLCVGLRKSFVLRQREGLLRAFVPGESFSIFNPVVLEMLEAVPEVRADPDLNAANEGVTILWLR